MKKIFVLFLALLLALTMVACGGDEDEETEVPGDVADTTVEIPETSEEPEAPEDELPPHNGLGVTIEEILNIIERDLTNWLPINRFYMDDGTVVETTSNGTLRLFTYQSTEADTPGTIIFRATSNSQGTLGNDFLDELRPHMPDGLNFTHGSAIFGEWRLFLICADNPTDYDFGQFPLTVGYFIEHDFFRDEERGNELVSLRNAGDFLGMEEFVLRYIEEMGDTILDTDSAFLILAHLEPMIAMLDRVEIQYDSFDDVANIFYRGLTSLSREHSFVPYTTTRANSISLTVGFYRNGWIFADRARLRLEDGETITFTMGRDADRDIIHGSEIRESRTFRSVSDRDLERMLASRGETIRFEGDDNVDHTLTELERNALEVIYVFRETNFFSNLRHRMIAEF